MTAHAKVRVSTTAGAAALAELERESAQSEAEGGGGDGVEQLLRELVERAAKEAKAIACEESAPRVRAALLALAPLDLPPAVVETAVEIARAIALRHVGRYFRGECLPELRYQLVDYARKLAKKKRKKKQAVTSR